MRKILKISGVFLLLAAIFYLLMFIFPAYFHPQIQHSLNSDILQDPSPTVSPASAEDYVILTCGADCSKCNGSGSGCAEFMIEQAKLLCGDGKKGASICYYDLLTLTQACHAFCNPNSKSRGPKTVTPF